jgi:biopolymer transport protein ExbB
MSLTEKFLQFTTVGAEWVLWLLLVLSVFSVYVMIERWVFFRSLVGSDAALRKGLHEALSDDDIDRARELVRGKVGPGGRIVSTMLENLDRGDVSVHAAINAMRPGERMRLERNLIYLGTLGANAPFIGLFGTVLGIIKAFKDLAAAGVQATDNTSVVMAGISEALVATAVGLLVAIPAVVAYNYFQRRVKSMMNDADSLANMTFMLVASEKPPSSGGEAE